MEATTTVKDINSTGAEDATTETTTNSLNTSTESIEEPEEYSEEEIKKAEEFKTQGNDYFKGKTQYRQ